MSTNTDQVSEYRGRRQQGAMRDDHRDVDSNGTGFFGRPGANPVDVMSSVNIGASYNAALRAQVMQGMQRTHGNHAVQRALSTTAPAGRVAVQRDFWEDEEQQANDEDLTSTMTNFTGYEPKTSSTGATSINEEPFGHGPTVTPMGAISNQQPFGPAPAPAPAPVYGPAAAPMYGPERAPMNNPGMDDDTSIEEREARAEAIREAMSTALDDGNGETARMYYSGEDGEVCEMPDDAPKALSINAAQGNNEESSSGWGFGDVNNLVSAGTTLAMGAKEASKLSPINNATSVVGMGIGIHGMLTADNNSELVQSTADTVASGIGLFGGPYGRVFSGAYSGGQLLDKGADWIGDKIWGEGDHSLHHGIAEHVLPNIPGMPSPQWLRDTWEVFRGRGTEAQQENGEKREFEVELDHIKEARKEREQKAASDKETAELGSQTKHLQVRGTMLGGPGDALSGSAIAGQFVHPEVDEDGEALPYASMALPSSRSRR